MPKILRTYQYSAAIPRIASEESHWEKNRQAHHNNWFSTNLHKIEFQNRFPYDAYLQNCHINGTLRFMRQFLSPLSSPISLSFLPPSHVLCLRLRERYRSLRKTASQGCQFSQSRSLTKTTPKRLPNHEKSEGVTQGNIIIDVFTLVDLWTPLKCSVEEVNLRRLFLSCKCFC